MPDRIELLRKIQALAERGVGGEKRNAEELLARMMAAYSITEQDLKKDEIKFQTFPYKTDLDRRLIKQMIYMVTGETPCGVKRVATGRTLKEVGVDCTDAQRVEIEIARRFYAEAMEKDLDVFFVAFCKRNNLYPPNGETVSVDEMTSSEALQDKRASIMAAAMEEHTMRKMLT